MAWNTTIGVLDSITYIKKRIAELNAISKLNTAQQMELTELQIELKQLTK